MLRSLQCTKNIWIIPTISDFYYITFECSSYLQDFGCVLQYQRLIWVQDDTYTLWHLDGWFLLRLSPQNGRFWVFFALKKSNHRTYSFYFLQLCSLILQFEKKNTLNVIFCFYKVAFNILVFRKRHLIILKVAKLPHTKFPDAKILSFYSHQAFHNPFQALYNSLRKALLQQQTDHDKKPGHYASYCCFTR